MVSERGDKGQNLPTGAAMATTDSVEGGASKVRSSGGEDYATPPRTHQDQEISSAARNDSENPTPSPGAGVGSMSEEKSPQTVSSTDTIGSTPLDPEKADQPATKRELLRLRKAVKETRTALVEEVCQREL